MSKLRLGIIGCGRMAGNHFKDLGELADLLEVTSLCDVNLENLNKSAEDLGKEVHTTTNYMEMVDYVDAVLISLPHDLHFECGMFFANNKKHILMEKPLCNTEKECLRLIETAKANDVTLMTAYPVRFWPQIVKLKEIVDSKEYGNVIQMSIWTEQFTKYDDYHWAHTGRLGGGQLFSHGCHYIDILLWFLGEPVTGCHIGTRVGTPWLLEEGTSNVVIEFESGALGYHFATWGMKGTKQGCSFQIHFEEAMVEYNWNTGELLLYKGREATPIAKEDDKVKNSKKTHMETRHFIDCVLNKTKPLTDGESSLQSLRVIWKLYDGEKHGAYADLRGLGIK